MTTTRASSHEPLIVMQALKQEMRFLKALVGAMGILGVLFLLLGQREVGAVGSGASSVQQEIRAERIILVDSDGRERAELGITPDGGARLSIRDKSMRKAAWVGVFPDGRPSFSIINSRGGAYAELTLLKDLSRLVLSTPGGKTRAGIAISTDGTSGLDLFDGAGELRASVSVDRLGVSSALSFMDKSSTPRVALGVAKEGAAEIVLTGARGRPRFQLAVPAEGLPVLRLLDDCGRLLWNAP